MALAERETPGHSGAMHPDYDAGERPGDPTERHSFPCERDTRWLRDGGDKELYIVRLRSEEHTSELQSH